MTDKEIIEYLEQDKYTAAFEGLYNILPLVKKYIRDNNGTGQDAQDIFQDALVILCKKVKSGNFVLTAPLRNYLLSIVKNSWLQELRQRKKLPVAETGDDPAYEETEEEPSFKLAETAFDSLGEKCRQLLIMFYYHKRSYKEIAMALAFGDELTAKNQKYRCLQKAKENYITLTKSGTHE